MTNGRGGSAHPSTSRPAEPAQTSPVEPSLAALKSERRREARRRRAEAHARLGAAAPSLLLDQIQSRLTLAGPAAVAGYAPFGDEVDDLPLLGWFAARGWACALPVVVGRGRPLVFRRWRPGEDGPGALEAGPFGIAQPPAASPEIVPALLLVPLLAFDRAGRRLGYGAGFYDASLAALRSGPGVLAVGLAFAGQEADDLPAEPHDQPLDWVVTEREAIRCTPAARPA